MTPIIPAAFLAVALLSTSASGPEQVRGRVRQSLELHAAGKPEQAAALLGSSPARVAAGCGEALGPWCVLFFGEALSAAGRHAEAATAFAHVRGLADGGPASIRALRKEAEARDRAGETAGAIELYRLAADNDGSAELHLAFGDALMRQKDRSGAIEAWRRAWLGDVDRPASETAGERLAAAGWKAGVADLLNHGARLQARGRPEPALADAERALLLATSPRDRNNAQLARGRALLSLKRTGEAEKVFHAVLKGPGAPGPRSEAALALGRMALRRGPKEGIKALTAVARDFAATAAGEEGAFLASWSAFNAGDYGTCATGFDTLLREKPRSKRAADARWYAGLCLLLAGEKDAAHERFAALERNGGSTRNQALYWRARTAKAEAAHALFADLAGRDPLGWYGWLARTHLGAQGHKTAPLANEAATPPPARLNNLHVRRAELLAQLELKSEAEEEIEHAARTLPKSELRALSVQAELLGLHRVAYAIANRTAWPQALGARDPSALAMLFPRAHATEVSNAARAVGLEPAFVWSIMRRESRFDSSARSFAQAHGLMQVLLPTAQKIALLAGEPEPDLDALEQPGRALPLASWYLAELAGRFGHLALAAAAYNGGPEAVAGWARTRAALPLDLFVETIPFRETRGYVKGVLGDYCSYRALYGEPVTLEMTVPAPRPGAAF